jgi:transcription elongation factor GreA
MRVPRRRSDNVPRKKHDIHISLDEEKKLKLRLKDLEEDIRPREAEEVKELSLGGDYSENAGYQMAKSRLRKTNNEIDRIKDVLSRAEIIKTESNRERIEIGSSVVLIDEKENKKEYQILGPLESDPSKGILSYNSPLAKALIGRRKGDNIDLELSNKIKKYKILDIK